MTADDPLRTLEQRLGYAFRRPELLERALVHRSYAHEQAVGGSYERLEFLGDAVLGLIASEWLYGRFPDLPEGELSKFKAYLVSERVLAEHAGRLGLGEALRLGVGEERTGGRRKASLLADAFEAVLGAVFRDGGLRPARRLGLAFLEDAAQRRPQGTPTDPKTRLQELAQARGEPLPEYLEVAAEGPDHRRRFRVECRLGERRLGTGEAGSKKRAEQRAAEEALGRLAEE